MGPLDTGLYCMAWNSVCEELPGCQQQTVFFVFERIAGAFPAKAAFMGIE